MTYPAGELVDVTSPTSPAEDAILGTLAEHPPVRAGRSRTRAERTPLKLVGDAARTRDSRPWTRRTTLSCRRRVAAGRGAGLLGGRARSTRCFAGWYLMPETPAKTTAPRRRPSSMRQRASAPAPIPAGLAAFEVAGGGTCYTDGRTSYIDIEGSIVAIGKPGSRRVEVWMNGPLPLEAPALTRVVTYALSAALRRRRCFELHSGAVVDPESGKGVLIVGPSGSGKSTLTVHLAVGRLAVPDRRRAAPEQGVRRGAAPGRCADVSRSRRRRSRPAAFCRRARSLDDIESPGGDKRQFLPHEVFAAAVQGSLRARNAAVPDADRRQPQPTSRVCRRRDTMARLIRMSPWSCYDRSTAPHHLAVLSALATAGHRLFAARAGRDLLDPEAAVEADRRAACARRWPR